MFDITNKPTVSIYKLSEDNAIVDVQYNTRYELCAAFMRMQEFYESDIPSIKGKFFTIEQYMDEYARKFGGFSYTMDWSGFNIPSDIFVKFIINFDNMDKKHPSLLEKEQILINSIFTAMSLGTYKTDMKFYIIGSYKECPRQAGVVQHEIAHALYNLDTEYKRICDANGIAVPFRDEIIKTLKTWGYADSVIEDEFQAYCTTNSKSDWKSFPNVDIKNKEFKDMVSYLTLVFKKTYRQYGINLPKPHKESVRKTMEKEYKAKYGYNAGEMI